MKTATNNLEINKLQTLLKYTFTIIPIAAGADKFLNILVQWDTYLAPSTLEILPFSGAAFMMIVGVIEIIAGILVFTKTQLGAYIVSLWLLFIALSLLFTWHYPDVAVRDIAMAISAFVLAKLSNPNITAS
ncbi:hypothetical protein [Aequorivita marina]|uniref:hypothetical protein n=1 Tax=Aequorivita marina TaxID=3073654 RepID=UPI0028746CAD|nr:hypothetical protein [Aequorivita sp. S2608]MDS1298379.1 hypothetical protein [Aequorivita sp. S2608]